MSQPAFDFGDEPVDDPSNPTYTVGELADAINSQLRRGFGDGVWVRGEIDGLRHSGPHTYFTLVEESDAGRAVLQVSLFAPMKRNLTPLLKRNRLELSNGMKVRIFGHLDYYAPNGRLGMKMAGIDPRFTLGELSQARDQVVRRLVAAGLYDANRTRPLSRVPLRVGVVTSVGTAAWHDFHEELAGSGIGFELAVCDTRVQGAGADRSVAAAIRTLGRRRDLDCVVVIRGGGARNELATFDAEPIALAIATCPVPVLTGLGHEIDRSVADDVAHRALKTPTACAGALVEAVAEYRGATEATWSAIVAVAERSLVAARSSLTDRAHRVARRTHAAVERADERLTMRRDRLRSLPVRRLDLAAERVRAAQREIERRSPRQLDDEQRALDARAARLALLDPVNLLRRGWSITRDADGNVVRSVAGVAPGAVITSQVADGRLTSRIEEP
ncbi:MAG: exodeoxyribonuclease VII large subunit [Acidimicrobiia bacterium]